MLRERIEKFFLAAVAAFVACMAVGCETTEEMLAIPEAGDPVRVTSARVSPGPDLSIKPGDTLELFVNEDPSFDGEYLVRERGDIIIPEVGRIPVEGLSMTSAETKITSILEQRQLTNATVIVDRIGRGGGLSEEDEIIEERHTTIFLSGKVNRPGKHAVPQYQGRAPGIYEAILICGGLARFADERKIKLLRPEGELGRKRQYTVNLGKIIEGEQEDIPIVEGDIFIVPERSISL